MKKFTKVVLIVTAVFLVLGSILCAVGFGIGFRFSEFRSMVQDGAFQIRSKPWLWGNNWGYWDEDGDWEFNDWDFDDWEFDDNPENYSGDVKLFRFDQRGYKDVKNIDLNVSYGGIYIKGAEDEEVHVEIKYKKENHKRWIDVAVDSDTLRIQENQSVRYRNNEDTVVIISIPSGIKFEDVNLGSSAGRITISREIDAKNMNISVDAGECETKGKLTVSDRFYAKVGEGEINISEVEASEMELGAGVGEIDVDRAASDDVILDCGIGSIGVDMVGRETDYSYVVNCGVGEVNIGGSSYSGLNSKREVKNAGNKNIDIKCGIGEVSVEFD